MRLMNVDKANSSVLARPQAYKILLYTYLHGGDGLQLIRNAHSPRGTLCQK